MICLRSWISVTAMLVAFLPVSAQRTVIVLVGGVKSHAAGEHDFPAGVCSLQAILNSSPDVKRRSNISVETRGDHCLVFRRPPRSPSSQRKA
jgi:hypothetical protein